MLPLAASSRRALVGAAALAALAPATEARRKKTKRKKPQPQPPLAFAVGALVNVDVDDDGTRFDVTIQTALVHPASGFSKSGKIQGVIDVPPTEAELRAAIADEIRSSAVLSLLINGEDVPPNRVAVAVM